MKNIQPFLLIRDKLTEIILKCYDISTSTVKSLKADDIKFERYMELTFSGITDIITWKKTES